MRYPIKVKNIHVRINLIKVLRTLEPGPTLLEAKNFVWKEDASGYMVNNKVVDLSKIRRERHPRRNCADDFVFTQSEFAYVTRELDNLADFDIGRKEEPFEPSLDEAFRAGFEAGIASDDDVEESWKKFFGKF